MPRGQSSTTWFPELKTMLKLQWKSNLEIEGHFELVKVLKDKLTSIRIKYNVEPPMIFCRKCNAKRKGEL